MNALDYIPRVELIYIKSIQLSVCFTLVPLGAAATLWTIETVVSECDSCLDVLEACPLPKLNYIFSLEMAKAKTF